MKFRYLRYDEVDCRVATCTEKGVTLLLYKDARCDMNILDETVGQLNWKREHCRDNANCIVSIWDAEKNQWVSKEDTGTESNTEAEKGLASDSFKRACFNWGIGRELYTAPFIWIGADKCNIVNGKNGKPACYDRFSVSQMEVVDGHITSLKIRLKSKEVFSYGAEIAPLSTVETELPKAEKCCVCGKPVGPKMAKASIAKYKKVYCSGECFEARPIEVDANNRLVF